MKIKELLKGIIEEADSLPLDEKIEFINEVRAMLHEISPFKAEPVDYVKWVKAETVTANDYNPNRVAPPEMRLLQTSIRADGYTQPIVTFQTDGKNEVVDGFHRNRVGKECSDVKKKIHGYLPITIIKKGKHDRIASTIRHNRARGSHDIDLMSDLVAELHRLGRSDTWIAKNLGMDADEVLRLKQIGGLADLFRDEEFSRSWDVIDDGDEVEV